jgi:hypothetical protein
VIVSRRWDNHPEFPDVVAGSGFRLRRNGEQFSVPAGGTDAAAPDAFVTMAAGGCRFRFADLVELRRLIDGVSD